jgi:N-methylhydantoinase B
VSPELKTPATTVDLDPVLLAVMSNRFDSIVREMQNTLLRSGRSAVLNTARDFSCAIVTGDHQLISPGDGLPVHVFGMHMITAEIERHHPDMKPGDAFLHNDPYGGNTHAADHTLVVPVFVGDRVAFYSIAKAHQADCGNSLAATMMPFARDVYEEGALVFPAVQVQRDRRDIDDVLRICRARIRVPDQWYGDYLAMVGSARIGESGLTELCDQYGWDTVAQFIDAWFSYSEQRMIREIRSLPATRVHSETHHDPQPQIEDGIALQVDLEIDPEDARITIDLRDNPDCVPAGYNQTEASALANALSGVFHSLSDTIPANAGSFRRVDVLLRENCVAGIPRFPHSCSAATANVGARITGMIQRGFAEALGDRGLAEGACGLGPSSGTISGSDPERDGEPYVNLQLFSAQGGPAGPHTDGWITYATVITAGLMNRDSIEVVEQKYPLQIDEVRIRPDSGGAGEHRGAPGTVVAFGPRAGSMTVRWNMDGAVYPPLGTRGGGDGAASVAFKRSRDGDETTIPDGSVHLEPGDLIVHLPNGGGGFGDPFDRPATAVLADVRAQFVTRDGARRDYGVVIVSLPDGELVVDEAATASVRSS